jgi:hypothetical protein
VRQLLDAPPRAAELGRLDAQAEAMVAQANALVLALEASGLAAQVQVINVAGRQRMLSQRMAKLALLQALATDRKAAEALLAQTASEFEQGLAALAQAPLSSPQIRSLLERGDAAWRELRAAVPEAAQPGARMKVAAASEDLLEVFDRLTEALPAQHRGADRGVMGTQLGLAALTTSLRENQNRAVQAGGEAQPNPAPRVLTASPCQCKPPPAGGSTSA